MDFSIIKDFMNHLTSWRIPGNSIEICLRGEKVFSYSSGYADLENGIKMKGDELFNIYSCSKVATVTAALQLYEKGLFSLDDPLYDFIPEYRDMLVKTADGELAKAKNPITLRHLFTMTAGFDYDTSSPAFSKAKELTDGRTETVAVAKCLASQPLYFEPGTQWQYSLCHDVLGAVVEVVSGKKFRDYMKENIFGPLGMNETSYHIVEGTQNRFAQQYHFKDSEETDFVKMQASSMSFEGGSVLNVGIGCSDEIGPEFDSGGGGIITTVSDYSKFCSALSLGGTAENGYRVISNETLELLRTNQLTSPELMKNFNWSQLKGYGYGLGVRTLIDKKSSGSTGNIGEFGWGGAAGATVLIDPSIKLSVFYTHHMLNPQEHYYQPRLRNAVYDSLK